MKSNVLAAVGVVKKPQALFGPVLPLAVWSWTPQNLKKGEIWQKDVCKPTFDAAVGEGDERDL